MDAISVVQLVSACPASLTSSTASPEYCSAGSRSRACGECTFVWDGMCFAVRAWWGRVVRHPEAAAGDAGGLGSGGHVRPSLRMGRWTIFTHGISGFAQRKSRSPVSHPNAHLVLHVCVCVLVMTLVSIDTPSACRIEYAAWAGDRAHEKALNRSWWEASRPDFAAWCRDAHIALPCGGTPPHSVAQAAPIAHPAPVVGRSTMAGTNVRMFETGARPGYRAWLLGVSPLRLWRRPFGSVLRFGCGCGS